MMRDYSYRSPVAYGMLPGMGSIGAPKGRSSYYLDALQFHRVTCGWRRESFPPRRARINERIQ